MGRLYLINLEGRIYSCKHCQTHLALYEDIVSKVFGNAEPYLQQQSPCLRPHLYLDSSKASSERLSSCSKYRILVAGRSKFHIQPKFYKAKSFRCRHGNAYLFSKVVNVTLGEKEERLMLTGYHTVADIFCVSCGSIVGWKYEVAHDKGQKYKEGKFILERFKVSGPDGSNYWINHESQVGGSDADDA